MITMPAGRYYVGDLCYVMHPQWDEFCEKTISGNDVISGLVEFASGVKVAQFSTYYGDGTYEDDSGRMYAVDAGLIGCIRVEDINDPSMEGEAEMKRLGNIIEFKTDFECSEDDGVLYFGDVVIDTKGSEDYDEGIED